VPWEQIEEALSDIEAEDRGGRAVSEPAKDEAALAEEEFLAELDELKKTEMPPDLREERRAYEEECRRRRQPSGTSATRRP
jgi:hypothetical protein